MILLYYIIFVFLSGQRYNQHGILTNWWTKESINEFNRKKACFVEQYSQYSVFGHPVC